MLKLTIEKEKNSSSDDQLRFEEKTEIGAIGAQHPESIGVVDFLQTQELPLPKKQLSSEPEHAIGFSTMEGILEHSFPSSIQSLSISPSLPSVEHEEQLIVKMLQSKGFSTSLEDYSHFFLTMLEKTISPLNRLLKQVTTLEHPIASLKTRKRASRRLQEVGGDKHIGNISSKKKMIFEQNETSNAYAKHFLQTLLKKHPELAHLFYKDMLFKAIKAFPARYLENKTILGLIKRYHDLIKKHSELLKSHSLNLTELDIKSEYLQKDFVQNLDLIISALDQDIASESIKNDFIQLKKEEAETSQQILTNQGEPRCITFVPCQVTFNDDTVKTVVFVGISGSMTESKEDNILFHIHSHMKSFCETLNATDVQFIYSEHATRKYDWLLYETNRSLSGDKKPLPTTSTVLPAKPAQPCAEKKVFSELAKQLMGSQRNGIQTIKVIGETNVHMPFQKGWTEPRVKAPAAMSETKPSKAERIKEEIDALQAHMEKLAKGRDILIQDLYALATFFMSFQNSNSELAGWLKKQSTSEIFSEADIKVFRDLLSEIEKFKAVNIISPKVIQDFIAIQDSIKQKIYQYIKSIVDPKASDDNLSMYRKFVTQKHVHQNLKKEADFLNNLLNLMHDKAKLKSLNKDELSEYGKKLFQLKQAFSRADKTPIEISFYLTSDVDIAKYSQQEGSSSKSEKTNSNQVFYYKFNYRDACEQCQSQKMGYLAILMHGAQVDLELVLDGGKSKENLNDHFGSTYTPFHSKESTTRRSSDLKLSGERCKIKVNV